MKTITEYFGLAKEERRWNGSPQLKGELTDIQKRKVKAGKAKLYFRMDDIAAKKSKEVIGTESGWRRAGTVCGTAHRLAATVSLRSPYPVRVQCCSCFN